VNNKDKKTLVFVRTKVRAERVKKAMARVGIETDTIHSDRDQAERDKTMSAFRKGDLKILIATDVSARGIDIPNVEYVVNYDLPESSEQYVHRVGRTGRGKHKGQAVSFCASEEQDLLNEIENNLGKPIKRLELSKGEYANTLVETKENKFDISDMMAEIEQIESSRKKQKKKRKK
jgi:ATP-dependent RNA helicase RhlE